MVKQDPQLVAVLTRILEHECRLHEKYLTLLQQERAAVTASDVEKIALLSAERERLHQTILEAREKRQEFMGGYPEGKEQRLSSWLKANAHPGDCKALLPQVTRLKELADKAHRQSREMGQLLNFSLNVVNGCLSIIWSATQNICRSYTANGSLKESYHPAKSRDETVLKEA